MGLIVFEIFFTLIFLILAIFLIARKDKRGMTLSFISVNATIFSALLCALYVLFYFEFAGIYNVVISKVIYSAVAIVSVAFLFVAVKAPYFQKNKVALSIILIFAFLNITFSVVHIKKIGWNALVGFYIDSTEDVWGTGLSGTTLFSLINYVVIPVMSAVILLVRATFLKSNIYKQQLRLTALAFLFFTVVETGIAWLTENMFSWIISFLPLGYLILTILLTYIFSLTLVLDKREIRRDVLRFLLFTFSFAIIAGLSTGYFLSFIRNFKLQIFAIAGTISIILLLRQFAISRFGNVLQSSTDYERNLEKSLQELDYGEGREEVVTNLFEALKRYVGCSTVDIFIADEKYNLNIEFSTQGMTGSFSTETPAFQYLIEKNIQVLLQTEILTSYDYAKYRSDLNALFWKTGADLILFVRDGQKLIAAFALGKRLKKAEYGYYDIEVFKNFYSYFFLVSYYLRNIAKQDIMITVDREIEMSGQIIGAIQSSINKVESDIIAVDSAEYSAHKLGGDFIDFIKIATDKYFFLIGDVSGKGLSASMSMVILKSVLRLYLENTRDFKELIVKLNLFVKENLPRGTFFAGLFGILDLTTQTIYYLNCGIPLMSMFIKSYNNAIEIQGEGRVLGFVKKIAPFLKIRKIKMNAGDIIVFTTDGLLDSENLRGDRFGKDRVANILSQNSSMSAKELADEIYNKVEDFVARELQDDVTILVFKYMDNKK